MNPEPISDLPDHDTPRTDNAGFSNLTDNGEEPLVGTLSADELRHLEAEGLLLSDVIREIEGV